MSRLPHVHEPEARAGRAPGAGVYLAVEWGIARSVLYYVLAIAACKLLFLPGPPEQSFQSILLVAVSAAGIACSSRRGGQ